MNKLYIVILFSWGCLLTAVVSRQEKIDEPKDRGSRFNPSSPSANVIGNNAGDGVLITNNSSGNVVQDNAIGTDKSTQRNFGNGGAGVHINVNSYNNVIGGATLALGNIIANNHKGVIVGDSTTDLSVGNSILNNSIYNNTLPGIDLANDGPTPNHAVNPFTGPNYFQNYPVIQSITLSGTGLVISWTLHSAPTTTYALQFFGNILTDPEGKQLLGNATATTDTSGNASGTLTVATVPLNTAITATATNTTIVVAGIDSETSEFSTPFIYGVSSSAQCPVTCNNK